MVFEGRASQIIDRSRVGCEGEKLTMTSSFLDWITRRMELLFIKMKRTMGKQFGVEEDEKQGF